MNPLTAAIRWAGGATLACALAMAGATQGCGEEFTSGSSSATGGAAGAGAATTTTGSGASGGTGQGGTAGAGGNVDDAGVSDSGPPSDAATDAGPCDTCVDWYTTCIEGPAGSVCDATNLCAGTHTLTTALANCACSVCYVDCPFTPCPGMMPTEGCRSCIADKGPELCLSEYNACLADTPPTN
ncbi:MAG: hypothetical protein JRI23_31060 [Deltaproteobacteria bacterium]|nr:hypothetical protein [Deltaproteobacteria bacterium]MBW2536642.1 hypothetical protein [Deltaproteobacteria bacterium]